LHIPFLEIGEIINNFLLHCSFLAVINIILTTEAAKVFLNIS